MAIFARQAYDEGVGVSALLAIRFGLAAACFWAIVAVRRPRLPVGRDAVLAVGLGGVGYAAQAACYFAALTRLDASLVALLLYIHPVIVFLGAVAVGRDRADAARLTALAVAIGGAAMVLLGGAGVAGGLDGAGVALAIGAAVAYACYILVADRAVGRMDPFAVSAYLTTGATVTFGVAVLALGPGSVSAEGLAWIGAIALVSTVAAIALFFAALRAVGPTTTAIVSTLEPVVTVTLALLLLGEALGPLQVAGGALVVAASVLVARGASAQAAPPAAARPAALQPARG
jgi:drug/metabolite transporter (DMT)-like permease